MELSVRYGAVNGGSYSSGAIEGVSTSDAVELSDGLMGLKLHRIDSWASAIDGETVLRQLDSLRKGRLADWFEKKLPRIR
jgi:hypothetical protein